MKITSIRTRLVELPADEPLANAPENPQAKRPFVTVELGTDDGVEGLGVAFFGGALTGSLKRAVDDFGALIVGDDPLRPEAIWRKLCEASGYAGPAGVFTLALSAIDTALWDIKAKVANLPLWKLLGGARERVPTYASGALMRDLSLDRATAAARRLVETGFREVKMQLALPGETSPEREIERARVIREAVGPAKARSVDIVMIDLVRVGGITQWLKVAGMAEVFNVPVVSHLIPEVHVHLIGAIPNGLTVEYMPWLMQLFEEVPRPVNGELSMPTAPGLGLKFDQAALKRFAVA